MLFCDQFIRRREKFCRDRVVEMPDDADGTAAAVADILGGAKKKKGCSTLFVCVVFSDEKQDAMPVFFMLEITAGGWRGVRGCTLRFPIEKMFIHGIIVIHC